MEAQRSVISGPPGMDTPASFPQTDAAAASIGMPGYPVQPPQHPEAASSSVPQNPCRLIVNYIPSSVTPETFRSLFAPFGQITNYKLVTNKRTGQSVGYGFIEYSQPQEAQLAIHSMNTRPLENKRLKVSYARNPSPEIKNANMYICGLNQDVTLEQLEEMFRPFGTIITANLLKDNAGRSRCCGFVRMSTHSEALAALTHLNGTNIGGKTLTVKLESTTDRLARKENSAGAYSRGYGMGRLPYGRADGYQSMNAPTLFVHGIPQDQPEEWLKHYFSAYGDIVKVNVPTNEQGLKRSYGFVTYRSVESAHAAINALNGASVGNLGKTLQVSFKTERTKDGRSRAGGMAAMAAYGLPGYQYPPAQLSQMQMATLSQGYPYPMVAMPSAAAGVSSASPVAAGTLQAGTLGYAQGAAGLPAGYPAEQYYALQSAYGQPALYAQQYGAVQAAAPGVAATGAMATAAQPAEISASADVPADAAPVAVGASAAGLQ